MSTPMGGSPIGSTAMGATSMGHDHESATVAEVAHGEADVTEVGVGDILRSLTADLSKLVNQEIELAKLELKQEATKAGKIAGAFAGAGVAGYFTILFLSLTLMFLLASWFDSYTWAALVVTVIWAIIGAVLFTRARAQAKTLNPTPETTVQTLKEDKEWLKTRNS